ncbi:MAG: TolC family protein [Ignavibacteriota bacterium]
MKIIFPLLFAFLFTNIFAQTNLEYYLNNGIENSPTLKEIKNSESGIELQSKLNDAQTSSFNTFLSANYLFAPYFNNNGKIISTNPDPNAIGYDASITNGGLYSAQLNIERNIFNGGLTSALENQITNQKNLYNYNYQLELRNLKKQITEQYLNAHKSLMIYNLSDETVKNISEQLKLTGELVKQGYVKSQNYLLLKIELQSQQIVLFENWQQYKNGLIQLNSLVGITDTQTVLLDSVLIEIKSSKSDFNFSQKFNLDSLTAINQQELFETKYNPQVKLFFNTGLNAIEISGIQRKFGLSAGIDFQLPLFDGGQKDITRQQNEIAINSIENYKYFALSNIENQKQIAYSNILVIKQNLISINAQLNDYKQLVELSNNQLKIGDLSMIEYLSILKNFIDLQKTKIEKEIQLQLETSNYNYWDEML